MPYLNEMPLEARLALLNRRDAQRDPLEILKPALALLSQKIALVSAFGAESAILLHPLAWVIQNRMRHSFASHAQKPMRIP
jgi:hypothetical protein